MEKGVEIPHPQSVFIDPGVNPDRIFPGAVIGPGTRLSGVDTAVGPGAVIGEETPATVENCWVGPQVRLGGGYFHEAVFLKGSRMGSGAHVRSGTILEENASGAHCVGLKQTVLFPFVTLGSLINFCDILMAGGTGRENHSEVGSAYIHFNFTPNQDKATASLLGDVAHGVLLDRPPIFLGGQGGLVGPCTLAFGTTIAAGTVWRKDEARSGRLLAGGGPRNGSVPFEPGIYRSVKRIVANNIAYIGNLIALGRWYRHVRSRFVGPDLPPWLHAGLLIALDRLVAERVKRLTAFCEKMPVSADRYRQSSGEGASAALLAQKAALFAQRETMARWITEIAEAVGNAPENVVRAMDAARDRAGGEYLSAIGSLEEPSRREIRDWLQGVVDQTRDRIRSLVPDIL